MNTSLYHPFTDINNPAPDISTLLGYLAATDHEGPFLYRGQNKEYDSPLVPSIYRPFLNSNEIFDETSEFFRCRLRNIGNRFVCRNMTASYFQALYSALGIDHDASETNKQLRQWVQLANSSQFASDIAHFGWDRVMQELCSSEYFGDTTINIPQLKFFIDRHHCTLIREGIFLNAFGYILGQIIAQQYGICSEVLDVTTDVNIAGFFATHLYPDYQFIDVDIANKNEYNIGVIYRFPYKGSGVHRDNILSHNYYCTPGALIVHDIMREFESDCTFREALVSMIIYHNMHLTTGERHLELLRIPKGTVEQSRIGRQRAAILIPDELRLEKIVTEELDYSDPNVRAAAINGTIMINPNTTRVPVLHSIEDLRFREGIECFYFYHTNTLPDVCYTPDELWPNDADSLLKIFLLILHEREEIIREWQCVVPERYDLLSPGYGYQDFHTMLNEIEKEYLDESSVKEILAFTESISHEFEAIPFLIRMSAKLYQQAWRHNSGHSLWAALKLCDMVLSIHETMVITVYKHMIYIALGDRGKNYAETWQRAIELAKEDNGDDRHVGQVFLDLYHQRMNPLFPKYLFDYYDCYPMSLFSPPYASI